MTASAAVNTCELIIRTGLPDVACGRRVGYVVNDAWTTLYVCRAHIGKATERLTGDDAGSNRQVIVRRLPVANAVATPSGRV